MADTSTNILNIESSDDGRLIPTTFSDISDLAADTINATLSLQELCQSIDSLLDLQNAHILASNTYHKWRLVMHRFVVLKLHIPGRSTLWLRMDRRPLPGLPFFLGSGVTLANDSVSACARIHWTRLNCVLGYPLFRPSSTDWKCYLGKRTTV